MLNNFFACDAFTAPSEGGLSMDPRDPGNWTGGKVGVGLLLGTNYGIAAADHPGVNPASLTPQDAQNDRKAGYWQTIAGDSLPLGVDLMCYDESVNAGPGRAVKILQGVLGVTVDGGAGDHTIAAATAFDADKLIDGLAVAQEAFYRQCPNFPLEGHGWLSRLAKRHAAAVAMLPPVALVIPPAVSVAPPPTQSPAPPATQAPAPPPTNPLAAPDALVSWFSRL